jgi:hypothetical protein
VTALNKTGEHMTSTVHPTSELFGGGFKLTSIDMAQQGARCEIVSTAVESEVHKRIELMLREFGCHKLMNGRLGIVNVLAQQFLS